MRKIFKVIGWFFSIAGRYAKAKSDYEKSGWVSKLISLLVIPLFLGLGIVSAYGAAWIFKTLSFENLKDIVFWNILKILAGGILAYIAVGITFKGLVTVLQQAIIAFSSAAGKKTFIEKAQDKVEQIEDQVEEKIENAIDSLDDDFLIDESQPKATVIEEKHEEKKKTSKGFDIFYGIVSLIYAVGLIGAVVAVCIVA